MRNISRRQFGRLLGGVCASSALGTLASSCGEDPETIEESGLCPGDDSELARPEEWTSESHCRGIEPDYDLLFADDVVHRFDITVDPDVYEETMDDLADKLSGGGPGGGGEVENPIWVPVTIGFNGQIWSQVGMRYKGNSSLRSAWQQGIRKLSFRLNFDKFADEHPETENQRFFGFKKMTFSNGFQDPSLIRDRLAAEIFRGGDVPAARGAFARVHVDFGEGSTYFGLYTMIEDPSDEMLGVQFDDDSGNLYKPEGEGAKWGAFVEDHFAKKTNEEDSDWADVVAAFDALHADRGDAESWRAALDESFDTGAFLRCLALNQAMENWDSYGFMTHNYYVYGDPSRNGRLVWFPWDLNESLIHRGRRGLVPESVMLDETTAQWPLIRFLLDDPVYREAYVRELESAVEGAFAVDRVSTLAESYHGLIAPHVVGDEGESAPYTFLRNEAAFEDALTSDDSGVITHVEARHQAIAEALAAE